LFPSSGGHRRSGVAERVGGWGEGPMGSEDNGNPVRRRHVQSFLGKNEETPYLKWKGEGLNRKGELVLYESR